MPDNLSDERESSTIYQSTCCFDDDIQTLDYVSSLLANMHLLLPSRSLVLPLLRMNNQS